MYVNFRLQLYFQHIWTFDLRIQPGSTCCDHSDEIQTVKETWQEVFRFIFRSHAVSWPAERGQCGEQGADLGSGHHLPWWEMKDRVTHWGDEGLWLPGICLWCCSLRVWRRLSFCFVDILYVNDFRSLTQNHWYWWQKPSDSSCSCSYRLKYIYNMEPVFLLWLRCEAEIGVKDVAETVAQTCVWASDSTLRSFCTAYIQYSHYCDIQSILENKAGKTKTNETSTIQRPITRSRSLPEINNLDFFDNSPNLDIMNDLGHGIFTHWRGDWNCI